MSVDDLSQDDHVSMPAEDQKPSSSELQPAQNLPKQIWTWSAESGPAIVRLTFTTALTIMAVWLFSGWQTIHIAGMICVLGLLVNLLAAYPLLIGSEKPDNSTPARALKTYFESLEHHGPLYRRMWLLLANEAKSCRNFSNFEGFRLYWKQKTREWRHRAGAWPLTPIVIQIQNYLEEPNEIESFSRQVQCRIMIMIRGRRAAGPVASYDFSTYLVQGIDSNWYLANGDLPEVSVAIDQAGLPSVPLANGHSTG